MDASCDIVLPPLVFSPLPTVPLLLALIIRFLDFYLLGRGENEENNVSHDLIMGYFLAGSFWFLIKPKSVDFLSLALG